MPMQFGQRSLQISLHVSFLLDRRVKYSCRVVIQDLARAYFLLFLALSPARAFSRSRTSVNCDLDRPSGGGGFGLGCVGVNRESRTDAARMSGWPAPRGGKSSPAGRALGVSKSKPPATAIFDNPTTLEDLRPPELIRFDSFDFDRAIFGAAFEPVVVSPCSLCACELPSCAVLRWFGSTMSAEMAELVAGCMGCGTDRGGDACVPVDPS